MHQRGLQVVAHKGRSFYMTHVSPEDLLQLKNTRDSYTTLCAKEERHLRLDWFPVSLEMKDRVTAERKRVRHCGTKNRKRPCSAQEQLE